MIFRYLKRIGLVTLAALAVLVVVGLAVALVQARHKDTGMPEYVALGSSFAAGAGLGPLQPASPWLCARSTGGYPQQLARELGLSIVDMSCGGALTKHVLGGGQFFQGPQIDAIDHRTRLVTLTVGGNDIGYIGDLSLLAARRDGGLFGGLVRTFWRGPKSAEDRDYARLEAELVATLKAIRARAPDATVVVVTYPTILPLAGTCPELGIDDAEAEEMRQVGDRLAAVTRDAAAQSGVELVDVHRLGADNGACASSPWTGGWKNNGAAPFHPTSKGAEASARAIARSLRASATLPSAE